MNSVNVKVLFILCDDVNYEQPVRFFFSHVCVCVPFRLHSVLSCLVLLAEKHCEKLSTFQ